MCANTPGRPTPDYIKVAKLNYSCAVIHLVFFFLISNQGYYTFHYRYSKHSLEDGRKRTSEHNTVLGQLQAQEREFVTLCILCAFVDYRRRVFCAKLQQKPLTMLTSPRVVNSASLGQQVSAVAFLTSVDSLLCPASIFSCLLLLTVHYLDS